MLKHLSQQCDKVAFPLIGAGIGAMLALSDLKFGDAIVFLFALLILLSIQSAASKYFDEGEGLIGLIGYVFFFVLCLVAVRYIAGFESITCRMSPSFGCDIAATHRGIAFLLSAYFLICFYMACLRVVDHLTQQTGGSSNG